jgi:hypothetical protein
MEILQSLRGRLQDGRVYLEFPNLFLYAKTRRLSLWSVDHGTNRSTVDLPLAVAREPIDVCRNGALVFMSSSRCG